MSSCVKHLSPICSIFNCRVSIECPQCKDVDVGPQQDLRFIGKCETCPPDKGTYSFSWKVYFAKMESVFLKEFGKCFKPDGSSWKGAAAFTHTTTAPNPMTKPPPRPEYKKRRQVVVCEEELRVLFDQSFVSNSFGGVRAKRSILDHYELDNEVEYTSRAAAVQKLDSPNNGELNVAERIRRDAGSNSGSNTSVSSPLPTAKGTTTSTTSTTRTTATNAATAAAEATTQMTGATTATTTSTSAATATTATTTAMTATTTTTGRTKKGTGATTETTSATTTTARVTTTGTPSAESTSTTALNSVNTGGGSSVGSGGRGGTSVDGGSSRRGVGRASGRRANRRVVPEQGNTRRTSPRGRATGGGGSQPGCISSQGNSRGSGSGRGSTSTNCVCFGCGAKNTTGGSGGGGGNSITPTPSPKGKELDDLHKVIERYMHPAKIGSQQTVGGFDKNDLVIKANSLVPGQQYMVELTTYRHSESNKTVSGISRLYFVTNTGPWKGTCKVIPQSGYEIDTIFRFKCENWKDMVC